jgi:pyruvate formate lyase activating enzyme
MFRPDFCISCGKCPGACVHGAIHADKFMPDRQRCAACGACVALCPANAREICGIDMTAADAAKAVLADESFFHSEAPAKRGGVTLSGGEPLEQPAFCFALLELLGQKGIHRVIDTSGHVPEDVICKAADHCDLFLYDIKEMDTEKHRMFTGVGNELILSNLVKLSQLGCRIQIRVPFIPGFNTEEENINAIAELAAGLGITGVTILPYHKAAADKHKRWGIPYRPGDIREPTEADLQYAAGVFAKKGLDAVIGG